MVLAMLFLFFTPFFFFSSDLHMVLSISSVSSLTLGIISGMAPQNHFWT